MRVQPLFAALAVAASFAAAAAWAQSTPLTPPLTPPTLEGTIKVYPTPQVQPQAPAGASAACVCTQQYDPVCGRIGQSAWMTYSNACVAACAGATEINRGPC
jgi:hypothetical protein